MSVHQRQLPPPLRAMLLRLFMGSAPTSWLDERLMGESLRATKVARQVTERYAEAVNDLVLGLIFINIPCRMT